MSQNENKLTASQYAQMLAVELRVRGLRTAIVALAIAWILAALSVIVTLVAFPFEVAIFFGSYLLARNVLLILLTIHAIATTIVAYYLHLRIEYHIQRLSEGKFEPPKIID